MKTLYLHFAKLFVSVVCLASMVPCVAYGIDPMSADDRSSVTVQGNSVLTATEMQPSSQRTGMLSEASDEHWFTFSVGQPGKFEVDFDGDYSNERHSYGNEWEIRLLTANNENVYTARYAADTLNSRKIITTGLAAGKYYLVVTSSSKYQNVVVGLNYKFDTTFTESDAWEQELNDLVVTPNLISLNKAYYGTLSDADDEDWFKLVLPSAHKISLMFDGDYNNDSSMYRNSWQVSLRDKDNLELKQAAYTADTLTAKEIIAADLPAGTYYLKVAASSTYYSVVVGLTYNFKVQGLQNIDVAEVSGIANKTYTGKALTQSPTVTLGGKTLEADTDYTLSYSDNVNVGTATMTITGKGAYTGSKSVTFAIAAPDDPQPAAGAAMHRLYNPNSGEHFYTASAGERDGLVGLGWKHEGTGWTAPATSATPVYRLYNPNAGDHHYTADASERDSLAGAGWRYEGVGWYSDDSRGTALLRLYNPNATGAGAHHYTADASERDALVRAGWKFEGVGWYGA